MPLLSIVVPVHGVQGFLRECLDSILQQSFTDIEVIAVDDASPDHCGAILDEYAATDPRVRVLHLERNVGLGRARNAGLAAAAGDFVWFVDSDDSLTPGALSAVAKRLTATDPDLLIIDYARTYWNGSRKRNMASHLLQVPGGAELFSVADHPEILRLLSTAWNKVIRRSHLLALDLPFETGWYEDISFTYPVTIATSRIAVLDRVCYLYRQRRQGAITRTTSERHFDAFTHWERTFALVDRLGPAAQEYRPLLFERMVSHYLTVLEHSPARVPAAQRRRFFARMTEDYRRYRPEHFALPEGQQGAKFRLVARGRFRLFETLPLVRKVKGKLRAEARSTVQRLSKPAGRLGRRLGGKLGHLYYQRRLRRPVDQNLAVFAAYWYRGYACNPAAIYEKLRELAPQVRGVWIVAAAHVAELPAGVEYVVSGTREYYDVLARAKWFVNNVNFPDFFVKRREAVFLQTHHGTPLKKMGLDQQDHPVGAKGMSFHRLLKRCDKWDLSLSANAHSTATWERSYPCQYRSLEVGYPRNDRLARATEADRREQKQRLGLDPDSRTVLNLPTHREYQKGVGAPLDLERLADELGPGFTILARAHYFHRSEGMGTPNASQIMDVTAHPTVEDLYLAADVLVTDYSSAMFDYAVLDRPIAIFAPDWDAYRVTRGVTFDLTAQPPGVFTRTFDELVWAFRSGDVSGEAATKTRADFRNRFCYLDDGNAAQRVVDAVFLNRR